MKIMKKLQRYMGKRKLLLPLSMFLSALSELAGNVSLYAWLAAGFAAGGA